MTEEQEVFLKHIQKQGLKRTAQRDLILDVFLRTEDHVSGEDLYNLVREQDPTVGQTTVYRTLRLLTDAGLAREVRFGDGSRIDDADRAGAVVSEGEKQCEAIARINLEGAGLCVAQPSLGNQIVEEGMQA